MTPQDLPYPFPPAVDFCGGSGVGTITEFTTDPASGLIYSSDVFIEAPGGVFNIYYMNTGPGPITFVPTGAFSIDGVQFPRSTAGTIPMTPTGSSGTFTDFGWGGTFPENVAYLGCARLDNATFKSAKHRHATAHFDLSFTRAGVPYTVRVNVHIGAVAS